MEEWVSLSNWSHDSRNGMDLIPSFVSSYTQRDEEKNTSHRYKNKKRGRKKERKKRVATAASAATEPTLTIIRTTCAQLHHPLYSFSSSFTLLFLHHIVPLDLYTTSHPDKLGNIFGPDSTLLSVSLVWLWVLRYKKSLMSEGIFK